MNNENQHKRNFSLEEAYAFLRDNKLKSMADEIQVSRDSFKSYTSTLKRAKIVKILKNNGLLDQFVDKYYPSGKTKRGQTRIQFWLGLYERFTGSEESDEEEETESSYERQFAYEKDLQDYLARNLNKIEPGLRLYQDADGTSGLEFPIGNSGRRIDILAVDKSCIPVIIELKVSRGYERTTGQILYYRTMVRKYLGVSKARIVIVANEVSEKLKIALENIPDVELFEYRLSMEVQRISNK